MPGTLFVIATPIGNLEDLTFRALRTLREVDLIAAEDTRRTSKLLAHYEIQKPMVSLREHNEAREGPRLVSRLLAGETIGLVTDAGTPGIADPGAKLVRLARDAGVKIVPLPGASAIATALAASGMGADEFTFRGFPPATGTARQAWLDSVANDPGMTVFFEAPHRIRRTLSELQTRLASRPIVVGREISKINEMFVVCTNSAEVMALKELGEFTVIVAPEVAPRRELVSETTKRDVYELFCQLTKSGELSQEDARLLVGAKLGLSVDVVRKVVKKATILVKQQNGA